MSKVAFDFVGENYVVTGASSGMGKQVTLELAAAGARVLAIARGEERLQELKQAYPEQIIIATVDVCNSEALQSSINDFVKEYGKVNGAVHAAGISGLTPLRGYSEEEARKIMEVSFWSGVKLMEICSKTRTSEKGASFVLFSSVSATRTDKGLFAYAGAKTALRIAVKTFAKELAARKIRVNTVSPGWVNSNMTAGLDETHNLDEVNTNHLLGIGEPEDVSGTILFLLSDRAHWITGTDVVVDGGYLA